MGPDPRAPVRGTPVASAVLGSQWSHTLVAVAAFPRFAFYLLSLYAESGSRRAGVLCGLLVKIHFPLV